MRAALGASRGRLVRQCLTESGVLGLTGGALGTVVAAVSVHPFVLIWPGSLPRAGEVRFDGSVWLFALLVSLASSLLFGVAPALRAPMRRVEQALRSGARSARRIVSGPAERLSSSSKSHSPLCCSSRPARSAAPSWRCRRSIQA